MPHPVGNLGCIKCHSLVATGLLKTLPFLSHTTVRRSAVNRKDLKPYWNSEKVEGQIFQDDYQAYLQFFLKILLNTERKLIGR